MTDAEIDAAFAAIPTVNLREITRIKTAKGEFDAEVLIRFVDSTQYAYTDATGVVRIVRIKN